VTDCGVQPYRLTAKPAATDWPMTNQRYATLVCCLMVFTHVIHAITWITTHLPTHKGWKAELAWIGWPIAETLPTKWSHVNYTSDIEQRKSTSERPALLFYFNIRKYSLCPCAVHVWSSLPNYTVVADNDTNTFKTRNINSCNMLYDYKAELTGIGGRSHV